MLLRASHSFSHSPSFSMPIAHTQNTNLPNKQRRWMQVWLQVQVQQDFLCTTAGKNPFLSTCAAQTLKHADSRDEMAAIDQQDIRVWASDGQRTQSGLLSNHSADSHVWSETTQACMCRQQESVGVCSRGSELKKSHNNGERSCDL